MRLDDVDLTELAGRVPTPFYAYSASAVRERITQLADGLAGTDSLVCYAVKANSNRAVLALVADAGFGADIVSAGELERSLAAGIPASRIVFSGVGKTADEIDAGLAAGVYKFNVESHDELVTLDAVARRRGTVAHAAVRINPDVDAGTHEKISTGKAENKFGVSIDEARRWFADAAALPHVRLDGLHVHIGSQILSLDPFRLALERVDAFRSELESAGHAIASIDVGGGLGVGYSADTTPVAAADYVALVRHVLRDFAGRLVFEPGRWLVADAGVLVTRVIRVKHGERRDFLVLDAAMNDLLRPSLYGAWHDIVPLVGASRPAARYDVVGPVCETGDTFAVARDMPECRAGDVVAIRSAGAYGACMASTYNSRPLVAEVLLDTGRWAIVRRRQTLAELVANECLPQWESV
jgi:diaminopimelate decarboxylase